MSGATATSKIWSDLRARIAATPWLGKYVEKLQERHEDDIHEGEPAFSIEGGQSYEKALELLAQEAESLYLADKLHRAEERLKLKGKELWLSVYEEAGLDADDRLTFDPVSCCIRKRAAKAAEAPTSHKQTLRQFKGLVDEALESPLVAGRMALDPCLPLWLQKFAKAIVAGDFKPNLRRAIEECLGDPALAREWSALGKQEGLPAWFVELTSVLGARKRWES